MNSPSASLTTGAMLTNATAAGQLTGGSLCFGAIAGASIGGEISFCQSYCNKTLGAQTLYVGVGIAEGGSASLSYTRTFQHP